MCTGIFLNLIRLMKERNWVGQLLLLFRGMAMGAVDVVPGVSGGTIALITGIYEELILSIRSIHAGLFNTLFREGLAEAWKQVNGNFLITVVAGILISIFSLARLLSWLFDHHAMLVWAFFFGLIAGSALFVGKKVEKWHASPLISLLAGTVLAYYITLATPSTGPEYLWYVFLSGSIAFCALILPGISGAFLLILLGKYEFMLQAVSELDLVVLFIFGIGGIAGVIAFSHVIGWLLKKHPNTTLALLTGFMIGSLNKLWPWKEVLETRISTTGDIVPLLEQNILPAEYAGIYGKDAMPGAVILCMIAGFGIIAGFMYRSRNKNAEKP